MTKVAVITGASRGLGLVLASEFTNNGWQVVGTGRSPQPADFPAGATYRQFDAADTAACEAFWQQFHADFPAAQVCLVNNAGGYVSGNLLETAADDYDQQMRSTYFSAVYMTRGLAVTVPKARIINVISTSALGPHKNNSAYGAAKAAEMHFFQALQQEFKPDRYAITNLYPNNIATEGPDPTSIDPQDLANFIRQQAENRISYYLRDVTLYPQTK